MALTKEDLQAIEEMLDRKLGPISGDSRYDMSEFKKDISAMKSDVRLLARLNHLDEVRRSGLLEEIFGEELS